MVRLTAHYDGKVLVPEGPIDLPTGVRLRITVETNEPPSECDGILALDGLGSDVWEGIDPLEYQRREREGWE